MSATTRTLTKRMTTACGTAIRVSWSTRLFQLTCTRIDGEPLTPRMEAAFDNALRELAASQPGMSIR